MMVSAVVDWAGAPQVTVLATVYRAPPGAMLNVSVESWPCDAMAARGMAKTLPPSAVL
jgi:hypothetical protein